MLVACAAVVLLALTVSACGTGEIDDGAVEDHIEENVGGAPVEEVTCPEGLEIEEGATFECDVVRAGGRESTITMRQDDDDGSVVFATLDATRVEDYVREQSRVPQVIRDVICPEDRPFEKGDTFECRILIEDGSEEAIKIRQDDDDGTIVAAGNRQTRLPRDRSNLEILPENVEALIRGEAPQRRRIVSVDCPAGVELRKGATFECVVRFDDRSETIVEITQRDALGNVEITGTRKKRNP
jgi:hypothetical protein